MAVMFKEFQISSDVNKPTMCGIISDFEICVTDSDTKATYGTNISNGRTLTVTEGGSNVYTKSCVPINNKVILFCKGGLNSTGDSLDGCITLCDRQWNTSRDISIPRNNRSNDTSVHVDVDRDGTILAAQYGQSNIYVINPDNGEIVNTITMQGKVVMGEIQALSSGDIVVKTDTYNFTVITRSGYVKATIQCNHLQNPRCRVDKLTDTLYITYWYKEDIYAVVQVSCDGITQARRIVDYKQSDRCFVPNPCLVTPSGNLVACDGDKLLVYRK